MFYAIDLGGTTVDVLWLEKTEDVGAISNRPNFQIISSLQSSSIDKSNLYEIFEKSGITDYTAAEKIVLTGGHSRHFSKEFEGIPLEIISEINAIGAGGIFLTGEKEALVCSLGTGTCCVSAKSIINYELGIMNEKEFGNRNLEIGNREKTQNSKLITHNYLHVGGTGVGGGTFLGLARTILGIDDFDTLMQLVEKGDPKKVDLLVSEIVGGGIGVVPGSATASNFAKADAEKNPADLARGIANLVGQTIASITVFASRSSQHKKIILGGKLIRLPLIVEIIQNTAKIFEREIIVPKSAEVLSAVGAGICSMRK